MTRRAVLVVLVAALVPVCAASGSPLAPSGGGSFYVVRADPRACPSPLCGGYWVALANHARTRCSDGTLRPRCYVGRALDQEGQPLAVAVADGALVRGVVEPWTHPGFGELGQLVVETVRAPVGKGGKGSFSRVRDLGIRCVRAPCYSLRAARLNGSARRLVSSLDLVSLVRPTTRQLAQAEAAVQTPTGLLLLGRVIETSDAGAILQASRFYLTTG